MNIKKVFAIVLVIIMLFSITACQNGVKTKNETLFDTYTIDEIISNIYKNSLEPEEEEVFSEDYEPLPGEKPDPIYLRRASDWLVGEQINIAPFDSSETDAVFAYYPVSNGGKIVILLDKDQYGSSKTAMLVCKTELSVTDFVNDLSTKKGFLSLEVERVDIIHFFDFMYPWNTVCGEYNEITNYGEIAYDSDLYPLSDESPFFGIIFSEHNSFNGEEFFTVTLDDDSSFQDVYDRFGVQINDK